MCPVPANRKLKRSLQLTCTQLKIKLKKHTRTSNFFHSPFLLNLGLFSYKYVVFTGCTCDNCLHKCSWDYKKIYTTVLRAMQLTIHVNGYCTPWTGDWGTESLFFGSKHLAMCWKSSEPHILQSFTLGQNSISLKFRTSWPGTKPFLLYWITESQYWDLVPCYSNNILINRNEEVLSNSQTLPIHEQWYFQSLDFSSGWLVSAIPW